MNSLSLTAPAKLNLSLDVLHRREDGYHQLQMVMQSVSLVDRLTLRETEGEGIDCLSNLPYLPRDAGNLAVRAALVFFQETGLPQPGLSIEIEKQIPSGAGMAGGSSDAAAVLRGLRTLYAPSLSQGQLEEMGAKIGSDVPYCLRGGTALAEGRGEILTPLPALPPCWFVICKPAFSISTPELFGRVQVRQIHLHPDTRGMTQALQQGDLEGVARRMYNVLEAFLPRRCGEILRLKSRLVELGALNAVMTGTGSAVFGLFATQAAARRAMAALEGSVRCFLAQPV